MNQHIHPLICRPPVMFRYKFQLPPATCIYGHFPAVESSKNHLKDLLLAEVWPQGENQQNTVENFSLHFSPSSANHDRIVSRVSHGGKIEQSGMQRIKSELYNLDPAALGNYVTRFGLVVIGRLPPRRAKQSLAFGKHKQKVRCSCMYFLQLLTTKPCIQIFDIVIMQ